MAFDEAEMDMIRRGDMLGPKLGAKVATALETLQRERDEAREALREAEPYVETLHSLVAARDVRRQVMAVIRKMRAALSPKEAEE